MTSLEIYLLVAPVLVVALGVAVFFLTGWLDRREERRNAR
jgi:hypothetical protein